MPGQEIFRFVQLAAPKKRGTILASKLQETPFVKKILDARSREGAAKKIFELAGDFLNSDEFNTDTSRLPLALKASNFIEALRERPVQNLADYEGMINDIFSLTPARLIENMAFRELRNKVFNGLLALKLLPEKHSSTLPNFANLQRAFSIIERVAAKDKQLSKVQPKSLAIAVIELPEEIFPLPVESVEVNKPIEDEREKEMARLSGAIVNLT